MDMLEQCPFCGGDAEIARNTTAHSGWYARCRSCKSDGGQFLVRTKVFKGKIQAAEAWNTRYERTDSVEQVARDAIASLRQIANRQLLDPVPYAACQVDTLMSRVRSLGVEV